MDYAEFLTRKAAKATPDGIEVKPYYEDDLVTLGDEVDDLFPGSGAVTRAMQVLL